MTTAASPAGRRAVLGWSLYDLANTIFYLLTVTVYLPKYLSQESGRESTISWAVLPALLLSASLSPLLGARMQRLGGAKGWTLGFTAASCLLIALLGVPWSVPTLCILAAGSLFAYQMASVSYQSLLPAVASPEAMGRVSGYGVALGYLGNVVAMGLIAGFELERRLGLKALFVVAAAAFLAFALPFARWVPVARPTAQAADLAWQPGALGKTLRLPGVRAFLLGNFLVCDAINTVLIQLSRFAEQESGIGLDARGRTYLLIGVNIAAVVGALVMGAWGDRRGGRRVTWVSGALLFIAMAAAQWAPSTWLKCAAIVACGGVGIAGVWTAGRLWLLQLVPPERSSHAIGLYGLTMKASLLSLFPFTFLVDRTGSYAASVALLLGLFGAGLACWALPGTRLPSQVVSRGGATGEGVDSGPADDAEGLGSRRPEGS